MFKADVDSAFRRIPVMPDHREFGHIAFKYKDKVMVAEHASMPFGSIGSVHHWECIGKPYVISYDCSRMCMRLLSQDPSLVRLHAKCSRSQYRGSWTTSSPRIGKRPQITPCKCLRGRPRQECVELVLKCVCDCPAGTLPPWAFGDS